MFKSLILGLMLSFSQPLTQPVPSSGDSALCMFNPLALVHNPLMTQPQCSINDINYVWMTKSDLSEEEAIFVNAFSKAYEHETIQSLGLDATKFDTIEQWLHATFESTRIRKDHAIENGEQTWFFVSAYKNGRVAGFAAFEKTEHENEFYIAQLAVNPEDQGQGIGQALVFSIVDLFHSTHTLTVITRTINEKALSFYKKCGFQATSLTHPEYDPRYYTPYFVWTKDGKGA